MKSQARAGFIIAVTIYGLVGVATHFITFPSEIITVTRGSIGALFIALFMLVRRHRPQWRTICHNLGYLALGGGALGFNWVLLLNAYHHTTQAIAVLCDYMSPVYLVFLSPWLFSEKLNTKKVVSILAAVVGITLVSGVAQGGSTFNSESMLGVILALGSGVAATVLVIASKMTSDVNCLDQVLVELTFSVLIVGPYALWNNWGKAISLDTRSVVLTLILAIVATGIAYILYFDGISALPVQESSLLSYIQPVVTVMASALLLRETMTPSIAVGAVLVLGAAAFSELNTARVKEGLYWNRYSRPVIALSRHYQAKHGHRHAHLHKLSFAH
ncbi:MAG: EamA family transporter [Actinomycetaceae bacterium]|nr:EamA family transporter [Actinomycetaceae bacterium]MDY6083368.1 EamA family transporter [Actinomycetaceae bacterium]